MGRGERERNTEIKRGRQEWRDMKKNEDKERERANYGRDQRVEGRREKGRCCDIRELIRDAFNKIICWETSRLETVVQGDSIK